ncbi:hypothetical protein BKA82DRAFT_4075937 [Pisolithus tinctorius]|nr:hypothetical protein BKA82DRAFT_4075937 [Pisolithus tinctorius]
MSVGLLPLPRPLLTCLASVTCTLLVNISITLYLPSGVGMKSTVRNVYPPRIFFSTRYGNMRMACCLRRAMALRVRRPFRSR